MIVLVPTLQVFWSVKPTNVNIYMLHVECTHLQDLRCITRETVKGWVFVYTTTNQDEVIHSIILPETRSVLAE
jgi:predicted DNA-binding transcriptional regulator